MTDLQPGETAPPYTDVPATPEASAAMTPTTQIVESGVQDPVVASGGETLEEAAAAHTGEPSVQAPPPPPDPPKIEEAQIVTPSDAEIDAHPHEKWNFEHQCWLPKEA